MNHRIKAKNKNSQEVRSINVIDNGDNCEYYDDKWDVIYSKQEFNDLFEVVEDKPIKLNGSVGHTLEYDIPQTDTLKKEGWEEYYDENLSIAGNYDNAHIDDIAIKHFITQEIAKVKEDNDKQIIRLTSIIKHLLK